MIEKHVYCACPYIFVLLSEKKREFFIGEEYKLKNVVLDKYFDGWESIR